MGWTRRGHQLFYYQAVRVNGQPQRIYLGRGLEAEQAAAAVAQRQQQRAAERSQETKERKHLAVACQPFLDFADLTQALLRAALEAHGFHQRCRGPWRKRRIPNPGVYPDTNALPQSLTNGVSPP